MEDSEVRLSILDSLRALVVAEHENLLAIANAEGREGDTVETRYWAATVTYGVAASENRLDWLDEIATHEVPRSAGGQRR